MQLLQVLLTLLISKYAVNVYGDVTAFYLFTPCVLSLGIPFLLVQSCTWATPVVGLGSGWGHTCTVWAVPLQPCLFAAVVHSQCVCSESCLFLRNFSPKLLKSGACEAGARVHFCKVWDGTHRWKFKRLWLFSHVPVKGSRCERPRWRQIILFLDDSTFPLIQECYCRPAQLAQTAKCQSAALPPVAYACGRADACKQWPWSHPQWHSDTAWFCMLKSVLHFWF